MADTTHSLQMTFKTTDADGATLTKSFVGYNTGLADDAIRTAAKTIASTAIFANKKGTITSVKKLTKVTTEKEDIPVDSATA